jgi:Lrp/AsnC family transcriptional regulator
VKIVDETDRKILRILQESPDISIQATAERVGLSQTPCWRRIRKLEADGIIRGRVSLLDAGALGLSVNVFAHLRLKQHDEDTLEALERAVHSRPEILEAFSMSGESDYVLRIIVGGVEDYERFLKKVVLHLPGVASVRSSFALKCIKMTTALPI